MITNKNVLRHALFFELGIVFLCMAVYSRGSVHISNKYGAYSDEAQELYAVIRKETAPDAKIIFFKPRVLYLETGRLGFTTKDIARLRDADYLLLCTDGYGTFEYDIETQYPKESEQLEKVFENKNFKFYRIALQEETH